MAKENQGYISNLNLTETTNPSLALANLAGVTIPADLKIIQNNLRNISTISYQEFSGGFFQFDDLEFVFTDDDKIKVSKNVSIGTTTLNKNNSYFVCNSNGKNRFKISTTSSSVGFTTFNVTSIDKDNFNFIRDDSVSFDNIRNIIDPSENNLGGDPFDDSTGRIGFLRRDYFGSGLDRLKNALNITQDNVERANFLIEQKYIDTGNVDTDQLLKYGGVLKTVDPVSFNSNTSNLTDQKSPGLFIGNIRAFSSDNNPWSEESAALKTSSTAISVNELFFYDQVQITGINTTSSSTPIDPATFTHKLPIKVDGEIYYLLLKESGT